MEDGEEDEEAGSEIGERSLEFGGEEEEEEEESKMGDGRWKMEDGRWEMGN